VPALTFWRPGARLSRGASYNCYKKIMPLLFHPQEISLKSIFLEHLYS
jgi:hypothetical protein